MQNENPNWLVKFIIQQQFECKRLYGFEMMFLFYRSNLFCILHFDNAQVADLTIQPLHV